MDIRLLAVGCRFMDVLQLAGRFSIDPLMVDPRRDNHWIKLWLIDGEGYSVDGSM